MERLKYYSTNRQTDDVLFHEALLKGQAPDRGLYMPVEIPQIEAGEWADMKGMNYAGIARCIIQKFLGGVIEPEKLEELVSGAYDFDVPLEHVTGNQYVMRLDQGPTASFKDFAGRMMGRLMNHYMTGSDHKLLILTATSGDTGSAMANAFFGLEKVDAVVLFPTGEVSDRQRKQMTTLGNNIRIIGLDAKFDDCQALVKQAFADPDLAVLHLSSANSINIGRLIPQIVYYVYAYLNLAESIPSDQVIFSIPSGNFGDMMGGVLAKHMGLPVKRFIIATNENDEFPRFLQKGKYQKIEPSVNCLSSAMNVGHPSNLARLVSLYGGQMDEKGEILRSPDLDLMRKHFHSVSVTDVQTRETIRSAWEKYKLLLEAHGAVGWHALQNYLENHPEHVEQNTLCVSLETAHPAKFPEQIRELLKMDPELPPSMAGLDSIPEQYDLLENDYDVFKSYLLAHYKI